jgi:hypothetical protein
MKRPIIRYHGGKWLLAPWIISFFSPHRCYVEPFGGGGSVLLRKPVSHMEVYNDLDEEVVNLFRVARDHGQQLMQLLKLTPFARHEFNLSYAETDCPVERARRTIVTYATANGTSGEPSNWSKGRKTEYKNTHPTVKPTALMRYLCRLITPTGGMILDPFMGSGSTGKAAVLEGFQFSGIDKEAEYIGFSKARIGHAYNLVEKQSITTC